MKNYSLITESARQAIIDSINVLDSEVQAHITKEWGDVHGVFISNTPYYDAGVYAQVAPVLTGVRSIGIPTDQGIMYVPCSLTPNTPT